MFGLNLTNRALGLVRTIIIARLLGPADLGLFGIALLAQTIVGLLTTFGLTSALVRRPDDPEPYYDTAWIIDSVTGAAVAALMLLTAPLVAGFFNEPGAVSLIRVLAITTVLGGLGNPAVIKLRRDFRFGHFFWLALIPGLADIAVSLLVVIAYPSPMALILGLVARSAVALVLSYVFVPYLPHIRFNAHKARVLLSYGKWITGSTFLRFVYGQGDDILVGRFLGVTSLGLYQIAYKYSNMPTTEVTRVLQLVAMPAYAAVQDDAARLRRAFLEALEATSLVGIGLAGFIWVVTPDFVQIFLGSQWLDAIPIMRILAVWGAVEAVSEIPIAMFEAVGRPGLGTRRILVKTLVLAAIIWPMMSAWGLIGVSFAVLASAIPALVWSLYDACRIAHTRGSEVAVALGVPSLGVVLAGLGSVAFSTVVPIGTVASFVGTSAVCLLAFALVGLVSVALGYRAPNRLLGRLRGAVTR